MSLRQPQPAERQLDHRARGIHPALRVDPRRIRQIPACSNHGHQHHGILLVAEALFDECDQALRAEEVVEGGTQGIHFRDI